MLGQTLGFALFSVIAMVVCLRVLREPPAALAAKRTA